MNSFWGKIAVFAVVIGVLILVVKKVTKDAVDHIDEQKTISEVFEADEKKLRAEPGAEAETEEIEEITEQPKDFSDTAVVKLPVKKPVAVRQFRELSLEEQVHADKLFEVAMMSRKQARLPGISGTYKRMVETCRELIKKYPGTTYEYKARRMLAEVPQRFRKQYEITEEELDLGN